MYCHNCGKEIGDHIQFCSYCGAQMDAATLPGGSLHDKPPAYVPQLHPDAKSRMAAGLLAFLLGHLGLHNFYLGFTTKAVIQLACSVLSCGFLVFPMWVWAIVEGIMIFSGKITHDSNGIPFKD